MKTNITTFLLLICMISAAQTPRQFAEDFVIRINGIIEFEETTDKNEYLGIKVPNYNDSEIIANHMKEHLTENRSARIPRYTNRTIKQDGTWFLNEEGAYQAVIQVNDVVMIFSYEHNKRILSILWHKETTEPKLSPTKSKTQSIESEIKEFARNEYPNDNRMQDYIYRKQMSAYRYMQTVSDDEVKRNAHREYPNDYSMQKYVYDKQLAAKNYMRTVSDSEVKGIAIKEYPNDYSMQKYVYDKQLAAKNYMQNVTNASAKVKARRQYPTDYVMQQYVYDQLIY